MTEPCSALVNPLTPIRPENRLARLWFIPLRPIFRLSWMCLIPLRPRYWLVHLELIPAWHVYRLGSLGLFRYFYGNLGAKGLNTSYWVDTNFIIIIDWFDYACHQCVIIYEGMTDNLLQQCVENSTAIRHSFQSTSTASKCSSNTFL